MKSILFLASFTLQTICGLNILAQNTCQTASQFVGCNSYYTGSTIGVANDNATSGAGPCITSVGTAGQNWFVFYYPYFGGGTVTISTAFPDTNFDTKIHVYTGDCGNLTCITGDDDGGGGLSSLVSFDPSFFVPYYIRIGGFSGQEGTYGFQITCPTLGCTDAAACNYDPLAGLNDGSCFYIPVNDGYYSASPLSFPGTYLIDNRCTFEDYDVDVCTGTATKDVWYYFIYTGGNILLYTSSQPQLDPAVYDTAILVYDYYYGGVVACNDDFVGTASQLQLDCSLLTLGGLYMVQVSGYNGANGQFYFVADQMDTFGCTDPTALNFDPCASIDNGQCNSGCIGDLNGDGTVGITDLLLFNGAYGSICN